MIEPYVSYHNAMRFLFIKISVLGGSNFDFFVPKIIFRGVSEKSLKKVLQNLFRRTLEPSVFSYPGFLTEFWLIQPICPLRKYRFGLGGSNFDFF